jgi:hypothetical protein
MERYFNPFISMTEHIKIDFNDLKPLGAVLAGAIDLEGLTNLPANIVIEHVRVVGRAAWAGAGPLTAMNIKLGDGTTTDFYTSNVDLFAGATVLQDTAPNKGKKAAGTKITATFTGVGGNMDALTAGSCDVYIVYRLLQ